MLKTNCKVNESCHYSMAKPEEEPEEPKKPCVGIFGSFSATLTDGMALSFSTYGTLHNFSIITCTRILI